MPPIRDLVRAAYFQECEYCVSAPKRYLELAISKKSISTLLHIERRTLFSLLAPPNVKHRLLLPPRTFTRTTHEG